MEIIGMLGTVWGIGTVVVAGAAVIYWFLAWLFSIGENHE